MKDISGVEFKRDVSGKAKSVTIDLQKHGEALQFFFRKSWKLLQMKMMILKKNGQKESRVMNW